MKKFWKKYRKQITKILVLILIYAAITVLAAWILSLLGVIYFDGKIKFNFSLFDAFKNTWYSFIIVIAVQVFVTTVLCFLPGTTMTFLVLIQALYRNPLQAFLISFTGVILSSTAMFFAGKYGGRKLCEKIVGKDDCNRASELLNKKGITYFPIMMLFPMFPDDALVMIAGTLNMSLKWFFPSIIIGRGIGVACIIFGIGGVPYEKFTTPLHWILFVLAVVIVLVTAFYLAYRLNRFLEKRNKDNITDTNSHENKE